MDDLVEIKINSEIYKEALVFKTIEIFSNKFYCTLDKNEGYFTVKIRDKFKSNLSAEELTDQFFDHLNNQVIRERIFNETKDIKNMIIGKALFETEAFDEQSDYFDLSKYDDKDNYVLDLDNIAKI